MDYADISDCEKFLIILKICAENSNSDLFYEKSWQIITYIIINSKRFSLLATKELREKSDKLKSLKLDVEDHLDILYFLVNSGFDTKKIKDVIKFELEKLTDLQREKMMLEIEL